MGRKGLITGQERRLSQEVEVGWNCHMKEIKKKEDNHTSD